MNSLGPPTPEERTDRLVFYPVAAVGGAFAVTVLMTIAAAFGDPQAPANQWFNRHATPLLLWETALLVVVSVLAMVIDRVRTLRRMRNEQDRVDWAGQRPAMWGKEDDTRVD